MQPQHISVFILHIWQQREILGDKHGERVAPGGRFTLIIIFAMAEIRHSYQAAHNSAPRSEN